MTLLGAVAGYVVGRDMIGVAVGALLGGFLGLLGGFAPIPREFLGRDDNSRH